MYKAVFIDMDGTLLKKDHTISEANIQAIKRVLDLGIMVIPISARPLHGLTHLTNKVVPDCMPVVSLNGSYVYFNNQIIFQADIPLVEVRILHNELKLYNISVMYYSQMEWYAEADSLLTIKEQRITPVKINIQPFENTLAHWESNNTGPNKILMAGDKDLIIKIEKRLLTLHEGKMNIFKSQATYLEAMHLEASKTQAIQFLMKKFGFQQHEIIAIGDNYNDKGMIEFAGTGVAMGNAPDEIKLVANYVTDTNNNDGVAKALAYFIK